MKSLSTLPWKLVAICLFVLSLLSLLTGLAADTPAFAGRTPDPSSVTIAGSLQEELGCPGDWQADCANTHLSFNAEDDVWQGTYSVPAGSWEYKAALDDSWDENYGAGGLLNGDNIILDLGAQTEVKFYFDHKSHWVTENVNSTIATTAGSFQSEIGCPDDCDMCLIHLALIHPMRNDADHAEAIERAEEWVADDPPAMSEKGVALDILARSVSDYEKKRWPITREREQEDG